MAARYKSESEGFRPSYYVQIAKELHYPDSVIKKLRKSRSNAEATRIMRTERNKEKDDVYGYRYRRSLQVL